MADGPSFVAVDPLPIDPKEREAHAFALQEIEKLNNLLRSRKAPGLGVLEKTGVLTYIKAKHLGLLDG